MQLWIACIYLVSLLFETTTIFTGTLEFQLWIACIYLVSLLFETTTKSEIKAHTKLWIACIYLVSLLFETTHFWAGLHRVCVVNCLHLSCIFALWNNQQRICNYTRWCCELLAFILYLCSLKQPKTPHAAVLKELWIACIYLVSLLFETTPQPYR